MIRKIKKADFYLFREKIFGENIGKVERNEINIENNKLIEDNKLYFLSLHYKIKYAIARKVRYENISIRDLLEKGLYDEYGHYEIYRMKEMRGVFTLR